MSQQPNRLLQETSPYLLQHAYNPVNWFPWGEEALQLAVAQDKPILVSIGYAACHWCHVMERESFEDETTAALMNEYFINIKIDREERPDLDHIYMDALQAMNGNGGWPLNVFLTPEGKPFYGGTYFPPVRAYNRASWKEVLSSIHQAWTERREEIATQAENLTIHLAKSNSFGQAAANDASLLFNTDALFTLSRNALEAADTEWGGFGKAPKFPQSFTILYLLRYYHFTKDEASLKQALLSLDKMKDGGIYDQLGGGFARYSTDAEWLAPHFEKMLYDNALLLNVYSEAYQLTGKEEYRNLIEQTMGFITRELLSPEGGFYSALDADSEGVEGKFYTWSEEEIDKLLGEDSSLFKEFYDVKAEGNWEHTNILWVKQPLKNFCEQRNLSLEKTAALLEQSRQILLTERIKRIRPLLDDKILLGWNALMNKACSKAFAATGKESYRALAVQNMHFLLEKFRGPQGNFFHSYKKVARYPAFLDDLAYLLDALIHLQEITADAKWLLEAEAIAQQVIVKFSETETPYFFYTPEGQQDIIVRKKEVYDGATPSGNSMMASVLHHLSLLLDRPEWGQRSEEMLLRLGNALLRYPTSFGNWAGLLQEKVLGTNEITLFSASLEQDHTALLRSYIPHRIMMVSVRTDDRFPLLRGKSTSSFPAYWLCKNFACMPPVDSLPNLLTLIDQTEGR